MKNLKFSIYEDNGKKIARVEWKGKILNPSIVKDDDGNEYFSVPNYLSKGVNRVLNTTFKDRIKDMVDTVKNGDGDAIFARKSPFGTGFDVLYYLDRNIGEDLRSKTLEGFKNTEFKYALYISGCLGGLLYTEDGCFGLRIFLTGDRLEKYDKKIKTFDSEEEAEEAILEINIKAQEIADVINANPDICETIPNCAAYDILSIDDETGKLFIYHHLKVIQITKEEYANE